MGIKINKSKVKDKEKNFGPVEKGKYLARLDKITKSETKKGDEMWSLRWGIAWGKCKDRKVFDNLVLSEDAIDGVLLLCEALGIEVPEKEDFELKPDMIKGKLCGIKVKVDKYKGDKTNSIFYNGYTKAPKKLIGKALEELEDLVDEQEEDEDDWDEDDWEDWDDKDDSRDEDFAGFPG